MEEDGEYSMMYYPMTSYAENRNAYSRRMYDGRSYRGRSYAPSRYSRRGYSMANDETISELHDVMNETDNEQIRSEIKRVIDRIEKM